MLKITCTNARKALNFTTGFVGEGVKIRQEAWYRPPLGEILNFNHI